MLCLGRGVLRCAEAYGMVLPPPLWSRTRHATQIIKLAKVFCDTLAPEAILTPFLGFSTVAIRLVRALPPSPPPSFRCRFALRHA